MSMRGASFNFHFISLLIFKLSNPRARTMITFLLFILLTYQCGIAYPSDVSRMPARFMHQMFSIGNAVYIYGGNAQANDPGISAGLFRETSELLCLPLGKSTLSTVSSLRMQPPALVDKTISRHACTLYEKRAYCIGLSALTSQLFVRFDPTTKVRLILRSVVYIVLI